MPGKAVTWGVFVGLLLLTAAVSWWIAQRSGRERSQSGLMAPSSSVPPKQVAQPSAFDAKSVAVLPFVNMSADKADEYLSDGMTEELLNALTKVKGLRVPGRSSCFAFKGKNGQDIFQEVGEKLHVGAVIEGSVRKAGNQLRVIAQLIKVSDGFHLWSEEYDRDMTNIFAIQSDIAARVASALQVQLGAQETIALAKRPTENPEAYRLYLLGRQQFALDTESGFNRASRYYNEALQLDPNYALAYCGLADYYGWIGGEFMRGKEAWAKERELAQKALALDPNLADAHLSLGIALASAFDWRAGENEIRRSLELNPKLALAHDQLAWLLTYSGRFDEAIAEQRQALALDPLSQLLNYDLGLWFQLARRYDEAIAQLRRTLDIDPNVALAHNWLGWSLVWTGDLSSAMAEFQRAIALDDSPMSEGNLGYVCAVTHDRSRVEQILRALDALAEHRYASPWAWVHIYLGLGEKAKALEWLERSYEAQDGACWGLKVDPVYDNIRAEPRFQALLKKVGFDQ